MNAKSLREVLHKADPDLKIVSGGAHRGNHKTDESNFADCKGVICSSCGHEVFRSRDGLCMPCWEQSHEIELRDKTGITHWLPMSIIKQITHPARKEQ